MVTITYQNIHTQSQVHLNEKAILKVADNSFSVGMHYVLSIEPGISVVVTDLVYRERSFVQIKNNVADSYGLHFFCTDQHVVFRLGNQLSLSSSFNYNCFLLEDITPIKYFVEKETKLYSVCVIIDRELMKKHLQEVVLANQFRAKLLDSQKKKVLYKNSSSTTMRLIKKFKEVPYNNPFYEMYLKGFVYSLLHVFFIEINSNKYVINE